MDTDLRSSIIGTGSEPEARKADIAAAIRNFEKNLVIDPASHPDGIFMLIDELLKY